MGFPCSSVVKEFACSAGDLGWEDPLEKEMATHSSILAMDRGAWQATVCGVARVRHNLATNPPTPIQTTLFDIIC